MFKKLIKISFLTLILVFSLSLTAFADDEVVNEETPPEGGEEIQEPSYSTVLPGTSETTQSCKTFMNTVSNHQSDFIEIFRTNEDEGTINHVLACGIKTGSMRLWMVPYYVRYILEFIINISGLIAVGGIVYGGYLYLFAGVTEDKDTGKKAIFYGVIGLVMTLLAWAVVNLVIALVTG
ncbi:MAG: pilin [Patescibacteria group bacterium]